MCIYLFNYLNEYGPFFPPGTHYFNRQRAVFPIDICEPTLKETGGENVVAVHGKRAITDHCNIQHSPAAHSIRIAFPPGFSLVSALVRNWKLK